MKSRTSYFNKTIFWKNFTRFAPVWALYLAFLMLQLYMIGLTPFLSRDYTIDAVCSLCSSSGAVPFIYAFICSLVLFGDLHKSRSCNALHAMPLRRENWFLTNVASGFFFSLLPTLIFALLATIVVTISVPRLWYYPILWMLLENLKFLCFFGIAVFSAFCVGKRFAMALVYFFLNTGAALLHWLVDSIYAAQLYGIQVDSDFFTLFTPVAHIISEIGNYTNDRLHFVMPDYLPPLLIYGGVGLVLLGCALLLYRKRNLECAGDFMAVRAFEPVFLVVYTLMFGATLYLDESWILLLVGITLGYFTGTMLLKRTVRIFKKRTFLGFGAFAGVLAVSLLITNLDPLGIEDWMPDEDDVESVILYESFSTGYCNQITLRHPEEIEDALLIHDQALEDKLEDGFFDLILDGYTMRETVMLEYHLTNGKTVTRYYYLDAETNAADILVDYFNSGICLLQSNADNVSWFSNTVDSMKVSYDGIPSLGDNTYTNSKSIKRLCEALIDDIEDENLTTIIDNPDDLLCTVYLTRNNKTYEIHITAENENAIEWLRKNNSLFDAWMEDNLD